MNITDYDQHPGFYTGAYRRRRLNKKKEVRIDDTDNGDEPVSMEEIKELVKRLKEKGLIKDGL